MKKFDLELNMNMPKIFDFTDYRQFLIKYAEYKKQQNYRWSYQSWALKLGLKNNTSILKILNGQREAGAEIQNKISKYFSFDNYEDEYFKSLVKLSKATKKNSKNLFSDSNLRKNLITLSRHKVDEKVFSTFSHWINMVIRQSTKIKNFDYSIKNLKSKLLTDVPIRKIESSIKNLNDLGLINLINEGGKQKWVKSNYGIKTSDDIMSDSIKKYHHNMLSLTKNALEEVPLDQREFSSISFAMKQKDIANAKKFLRDMEEEFCSRFDVKNNDADQVYQLNIQLFPITKF